MAPGLILDAASSVRRPPDQVGRDGPEDIEPGRLGRGVAVMTLVDAASPAATDGSRPASWLWRRKMMVEPRRAIGRMLQDATPAAHCSDGRREATPVVAPRELWEPRPTRRVTAPTSARRMSHDRVRPSVSPGVASLVPRLDAVNAEVGAASLHIQRRYQLLTAILRYSDGSDSPVISAWKRRAA